LLCKPAKYLWYRGIPSTAVFLHSNYRGVNFQNRPSLYCAVFDRRLVLLHDVFRKPSFILTYLLLNMCLLLMFLPISFFLQRLFFLPNFFYVTTCLFPTAVSSFASYLVFSLLGLSVHMCHIFDTSFKDSKLPSNSWKIANVLPIHKKGCTSDPNNYRPISLTSSCCRVMERILNEDILNYLLANNLITKHQLNMVSFAVDRLAQTC
jgi:hypothetical protein